MTNIKEAALKLRLIDHVSGPAGLVTKAMAGLNGAIDAFNANRLAANRAFMDAAWGAGALAAGLVVPIRQAMRFEDALADVAKVTDLSDQELTGLRARLVQISRETPLSADELARLTAELAAAGVASSDLERMTMLSARAATAWGVSGPQAAQDIAKISTALGLSVSESERMADQINALSDSTASTAPDLLDFQRRVGSLGQQYGFTTEQTLAMGSALISAGATSEQAATGFQAVGRALVKGQAATKSQETALSRLGLTANGVAKGMAQDALGTVEDVFQRIRELPQEERASIANLLFGDEARTALALIENTDILAKSLKVLADEGHVAGSVLKEFETRVSTTSGKARQLRNRITAAGIAFGNALLPSVQDGSDALGVYADRVSGLIERNPELVKRLTITTAGLVAMRLAATGARAAVYGLLRPTNLLIAGLGYLAYTKLDSLQAAFKDLVALGTDLGKTEFVKQFLEGAGRSLEMIGTGAQQAIAALRELSSEGSALRAWLDSADGASWGTTLGGIAVGLGAVLASAALLGPVLRPLGLLVRLIARLARFGAGLLKTGRGLKEVGQAATLAAGAAGAASAAVAGAAAAGGRGRGGKAAPAPVPAGPPAAPPPAAQPPTGAAGKGAAPATPAPTNPQGNGRKGGGLGSWLGNGLMLWNAYDLIASIPSGEKELKTFMEANKRRTDNLNAWLEENVGKPESWLGVKRSTLSQDRRPDGSFDQGEHANAENYRRQYAGVAWESGLHRVGRGAAPAPAQAPAETSLNVQAPVDTQVTVQLHGVMVDQVLAEVRKTAKQVVDQAMREMQGALNRQLARSSQTSFGGLKPYGD